MVPKGGWMSIFNPFIVFLNYFTNVFDIITVYIDIELHIDAIILLT